ncbi:MAG: hypothetical protein HYZ60_00350 [Methylocystis sp.]|nr:hypothetical protein [Methylocystis sp.]
MSRLGFSMHRNFSKLIARQPRGADEWRRFQIQPQPPVAKLAAGALIVASGAVALWRLFYFGR